MGLLWLDPEREPWSFCRIYSPGGNEYSIWNYPPRTDFRVSMDAYDLLSPDSIRVEVKSSAYIQAWESEHPARISFRIAPAKSLDASGNYSANSQYCRHSDVYVFCVWTAMSREQNILDLSLWDFYVIATKTLDQKVPNQKTITFQSLLSLQPRKVDYFGLYEAIRSEAMNDWKWDVICDKAHIYIYI